MYNVRLKQWMQELSHLLYQIEARTFYPLTGKTGTFSVSWGGGVPSPFIFRDEEAEDNEDEQPETSGDQEGDSIPLDPGPGDQEGDSIPLDPGPGENPGSEQEEESDDEVMQQPIPFQMGVAPMAEEGETTDELQTWCEGTEDLRPQARGSTDPIPEKSPKTRYEGEVSTQFT